MEGLHRRDETPDDQVRHQLALDGHGGALAGRVNHFDSLTYSERLELRARYLSMTVDEVRALADDFGPEARFENVVRFFENASSDMTADEKYVAWIEHAGPLDTQQLAKLEHDSLILMKFGPFRIGPISGSQDPPDVRDIEQLLQWQTEIRERRAIEASIELEQKFHAENVTMDRRRKADERHRRRYDGDHQLQEERLRPPFQTIDEIKFASLVWDDGNTDLTEHGWPEPEEDPYPDVRIAFGDETCEGVIDGDIFIIAEWGDPYDPTTIRSTERWATSIMDMRRRAGMPRKVYPGTSFFTVKRIVDREIVTIGHQQQHRTSEAAVEAADAYVQARRAFDGDWSTDSDSCGRCGERLAKTLRVSRGTHERVNADGSRYFTDATCNACIDKTMGG